MSPAAHKGAASLPAKAAARPMSAARPATAALTFHPATPDRWGDLERLFGPRGACAGCWCMWWRLPRSQWGKQSGEGNRRALRALVKRETPPGVLAYAGTEPVGWCAVAPREEYTRLERSRVLQPVDDRPVWSVTCFFVARPFRRQGVTARLLDAAAKLAASKGAKILEGYPTDPKKGNVADAWVFTGLLGAFRRAKFKEVARRSPMRPIMRRALRRARTTG